MDPIATAQTIKLITDYGLAIVGLFFVSKFLMWLIRYILERNKQREDAVLSLLTDDLKGLNDSLATLTLNMTNFVNSVNEAHKFQREEHKDHSECASEMIVQLKEITTTLGRINGFTHTGPRGEKGDRGEPG